MLLRSLALLCSVTCNSMAQEPPPSFRRVGQLAPTPLKEALYGALSPDGRSFVYEVVEGDERQLWLMDVEARTPRALTVTPGVRSQPSWSPDGHRVAYSRTQPFSRADHRDDGLWLVDVRTGLERLVYPRSKLGEYRYLERPSWTTDTTLMFWMLSLGDLRGNGSDSEPWTVRVDGSHLQRLGAFAASQSPSPDGRWLASLGLCCGGRQQALVVRTPSDSSARCLAGPIRVAGNLSLAWSFDARVLYFVSGSPADSISHVYRLRRLTNDGWSGPERIDPFRHPAVSLSSSRGGTVAVVVRPDSSLLGELWLIEGASTRASESGSVVRRCPQLPAAIRALVERSRLPAVRDMDVIFQIPQSDLSFFGVTYGREQDWGVYQSAAGLLYRGRIGWIVPGQSGYTVAEADSVARTAELFPLRASDSFLMSAQLLDSMDKRIPGLGRDFRGFLARSEVTPISVLRRLVQQEPRWNGVVQNGRLADPASSWADLTALAALSPEIAETVLVRPDVRDNPDRVYAIAQLPEYRGSWTMQRIVQRQFRSFGATLLANPDTPEYMLLELFLSMRGDSRDVGLMGALYRHRGSQRSRTLMTLFAATVQYQQDSLTVRARERLPGLGLETFEEAKLALVRRVREDTTLPPLVFADAASIAHTDWQLLRELYQIRGRDSVAERYVRQFTASSQAPLPILRELAESLRRDPQYGIASGLLGNPAAKRDRRILEIIAGLDSRTVHNLPAWADSLLRNGSSPR